jgi:hypothetical protein
VHDGFLRAWASPHGRSGGELSDRAASAGGHPDRAHHDLVYIQSLVVTDDRWVAMGQGGEDFVTDLWIGLNDR